MDRNTIRGETEVEDLLGTPEEAMPNTIKGETQVEDPLGTPEDV